MNTEELKQAIKNYIIQEFLPGENPDNVTDDLPLISSGILDSIATLKLVTAAGFWTRLRRSSSCSSSKSASGLPSKRTKPTRKTWIRLPRWSPPSRPSRS